MRRALLFLMMFVSVIYVEAQVTLPVDSIKTVVKDSIVAAPASFISFNKGTVIPISISSNLILSSTQPGAKFAGVLSMDIIADDGKILAQNSKVQGEVLSVKKRRTSCWGFRDGVKAALH